MLRVTPSQSAGGAKDYFDDALSRGDYYLEGQEMAGLWGGRAAKRLNLEGEVSREAFHQLCDNINPDTGKRLTARNHAKRRIGADCNFHCPKRVSYMETIDPRILDAFLASMRETMLEMEQDCRARVDSEKKFVTKHTGNMVWAEFIHKTSRPVDGVPDPHLHAHCFAFNATWDEKGQMWKAADIGHIKRDARYFEAAFHARLSGRLAAMGYSIKRDGKGFWDIDGIPDSVRDKFSRRSAEIDELARELGIVDPKALDELGAKSRQAKAKGTTMEDLRQTWDSWLTDDERDAINDAQAGADGTPRPPEIDSGEAVAYAKHHLFARRSAVPTRQLAEEALRRSFGSVSVEDAWSRIASQESTRAVITGRKQGRDMVTTAEVLEEERQMIAFARDGRGSCGPLGRPDYEYKDPLFYSAESDTDEQEAVIRETLASRDRVIDIRGKAGAGKTTLMREVVPAIEEAGSQVFKFAPSADASRGVMRSEGFEDADTVATLLTNQRVQNQLRGSVIWVDEGGQLGAIDMNKIFKIADKQGCRVILSGDVRQHNGVQRGDALATLEKFGGVKPIQISKIQRQRVHKGHEPRHIKQYRRAVAALGEGKVKDGFATLDDMGAVKEFDLSVPTQDRYAVIADDYVTSLDGKNLSGKQNTVLAVSPTHAEGNALTTHIRAKLKDAGKIDAAERDTGRLLNLQWTDAQKQDAANYRTGQVVQFTQNVAGGITRGERFTVISDGGEVKLANQDGERALPDGAAEHFTVFDQKQMQLAKGDRIRITQNGFSKDGRRLNNGALYSVAGFTPAGDIRLDNGWVVDKHYGHLSHGYVTTSHASQGKTVDVVLVAQSSQSFAASSSEQFYVSVSRGREQVRIYTDDKEELGNAIRRSSRRISATELVEGNEPERHREEKQRRHRYREAVNRRNRSINRRIKRNEPTREHAGFQHGSS